MVQKQSNQTFLSSSHILVNFSYVVNFPANHLLGYICKLYSYEQFLHRFSAVSFDKDSFGNGL